MKYLPPFLYALGAIFFVLGVVFWAAGEMPLYGKTNLISFTTSALAVALWGEVFRLWLKRDRP